MALLSVLWSTDFAAVALIRLPVDSMPANLDHGLNVQMTHVEFDVRLVAPYFPDWIDVPGT